MMAKPKLACPYCKNRYERNDLINHIYKRHDEMIPEGYTARRVVFDIANPNETKRGKCRICGKDTPWNESAGRYDVLCGNPRCKEALHEKYKKNTMKVYGKETLLNDPEQQEKMLANRRISGMYTFTDGGKVGYTGTFEKQALEFMDQYLEIKSQDILSPGPIMEYEYNGEKHMYIPDFLYIPYNLIIEVKDGGSRPNTQVSSSRTDSRARTIEKEKLFTSDGEYNYLRLTNNEFVQLINIFMDLKYKQLCGDTRKAIHVNEKANYAKPKICKKCGSTNIGIFLQGGPIFKCKDCDTYLGTVGDSYKKLNESFIQEASVDDMHKFYHFIWFNDDGSVQYDMIRVDPNDIGPGKPYDCPIELEYIPNNMGINLCSVRKITWNRLGDGQLVDLKIEFEPNLEHPEGIIECTIDTSADIIHETFMDEYRNPMKAKNLEYNVEKFPKQSNILFITGLSGSGKSSMAAKLAKKYDAVNIEIDLLEHNDIIFDKNTTNDEGNLIIKDYMEKYHHGAHKFKISNNEKAWAKEVERFLKYCIDIAKKNKDKIYILEGIQLMDIPDSIDIIKPYPIIVVNTSMIKSMWRAYKREECGFLEYMKSFKSIAGLKEYIDWYLSMEKQKNDFKKKLKESVVIPESPFSEAYATLSSFLIDHIEDNPRFKSILSETAENDPMVKTDVDPEKKSISNGLVKDPSDKPSDLDLLKEDE